jgi:hypothetical protein
MSPSADPSGAEIVMQTPWLLRPGSKETAGPPRDALPIHFFQLGVSYT